MNAKLMLALLVLIGVITIPAFAESPLSQWRAGIPIEQIQCDPEKILLQSPKETPACVTEATSQRLLERGYVQVEFSVDLDDTTKLDHIDVDSVGMNQTDADQTNEKTVTKIVDPTEPRCIINEYYIARDHYKCRPSIEDISKNRCKLPEPEESLGLTVEGVPVGHLERVPHYGGFWSHMSEKNREAISKCLVEAAGHTIIGKRDGTGFATDKGGINQYGDYIIHESIPRDERRDFVFMVMDNLGLEVKSFRDWDEGIYQDYYLYNPGTHASFLFSSYRTTIGIDSWMNSPSSEMPIGRWLYNPELFPEVPFLTKSEAEDIMKTYIEDVDESSFPDPRCADPQANIFLGNGPYLRFLNGIPYWGGYNACNLGNNNYDYQYFWIDGWTGDIVVVLKRDGSSSGYPLSFEGY